VSHSFLYSLVRVANIPRRCGLDHGSANPVACHNRHSRWLTVLWLFSDLGFLYLVSSRRGLVCSWSWSWLNYRYYSWNMQLMWMKFFLTIDETYRSNAQSQSYHLHRNHWIDVLQQQQKSRLTRMSHACRIGLRRAFCRSRTLRDDRSQVRGVCVDTFFVCPRIQHNTHSSIVVRGGGRRPER